MVIWKNKLYRPCSTYIPFSKNESERIFSSLKVCIENSSYWTNKHITNVFSTQALSSEKLKIKRTKQ